MHAFNIEFKKKTTLSLKFPSSKSGINVSKDQCVFTRIQDFSRMYAIPIFLNSFLPSSFLFATPSPPPSGTAGRGAPTSSTRRRPSRPSSPATCGPRSGRTPSPWSRPTRTCPTRYADLQEWFSQVLCCLTRTDFVQRPAADMNY